jgi:hypothetical protein
VYICSFRCAFDVVTLNRRKRLQIYPGIKSINALDSIEMIALGISPICPKPFL